MEGGEEGAEGQPTGGPMGFAAGLMMKARSPNIAIQIISLYNIGRHNLVSSTNIFHMAAKYLRIKKY